MLTPFPMDFLHMPEHAPSLSMTSLSLAGVYCTHTLLGRHVCKRVDVYIITVSCTWQIYALSERLLVFLVDYNSNQSMSPPNLVELDKQHTSMKQVEMLWKDKWTLWNTMTRSTIVVRCRTAWTTYNQQLQIPGTTSNQWSTRRRFNVTHKMAALNRQPTVATRQHQYQVFSHI